MSGKPELEAKIVEAIYRGACEPSELKRALELIAGYFDSSGVVLGELDAAHPKDQFVVAANGGDDQYFENYQAYAEFDPAPRAWMAQPAGKAALTDRIFSREQRQSFVFLNEFLRPRGIDGSLGSSLFSDRGRFAMVAVLQDVGHNYGDDDIARLERLTPHLARALQIRRLFLQSEARGKVLESIVDRNETGVVGLRGEGAALFVNRAAHAVATARDGIRLNRDGRLVLGDRAAATRLAALQADVANGGAGGLVRISRPSGRKPYIVLVSPLPSGDDLFTNSRGGVLFAIHDPTHRKAPGEQRIAELLHIPLGAAKVLQAILEGMELKEYADRAGISMNTVRFHLKSAFALTGARSQAELVRNAMSALNDLGPYFSDRS
jgi:regulatory LuxR family protein